MLLRGVAAAGFWIVAVRTAHGSLREYRDEIPRLREGTATGTSAELDRVMCFLLDIRRLAYGAFFTAVLSLAVIPLMQSWRQTATMLVDRHADLGPARVSATTGARCPARPERR